MQTELLGWGIALGDREHRSAPQRLYVGGVLPGSGFLVSPLSPELHTPSVPDPGLLYSSAC